MEQAVAASGSDEYAARPEAAPRRALRRFAAIAAAVVILDQLSKALVRAWLDEGETWPEGFELIRISHVENSGAAFGILQGGGPFLVASSILGAAIVLVFLRAAPPGDRLYEAALALVLGGAIGNLIDRLLRGTVTDFIDPTHYPSFNIADSAIVVGVFALIALSLWRPGGRADEGAADGGGAGGG